MSKIFLFTIIMGEHAFKGSFFYNFCKKIKRLKGRYDDIKSRRLFGFETRIMLENFQIIEKY